MVDPRNYQISVLCAFVVAGKLWLGFDIPAIHAIVVVFTTVFVQWLLYGSQLKSALISALSLVLLLRTDSIFLIAFAGVTVIAGKKFIVLNQRHVFNPSALALVIVTVLFDGAWLSPGQWGPMGISALLLAGAGLLVVTRAQRLDVALAFLITFSGIVILRGIWLGDPLAIALHSLQNGALIVFAFFMITDPKTTPVGTRLRVVHAVAVAMLAAVLQFYFYVSSAPLFALVFLSPVFAIFTYFKESANEKSSGISHPDHRAAVDGTGIRILRVLRRQG